MTRALTTVVIVAVAAMALVVGPAHADLVYWTGGGANNNWDNAANWGGTAVVSGNTYVINTTSPRQAAVTTTTFAGALTITNGGKLTAGNNTSTLTGQLTLEQGSIIEVVYLGANKTLSLTSGCNVTGSATITNANTNATTGYIFGGVFSGSGTLTISNSASLSLNTLGSTSTSSYSGTVVIQANTAAQLLNFSSATADVYGKLDIGGSVDNAGLLSVLHLRANSLVANGKASARSLTVANIYLDGDASVYNSNNNTITIGATALHGAGNLGFGGTSATSNITLNRSIDLSDYSGAFALTGTATVTWATGGDMTMPGLVSAAGVGYVQSPSDAARMLTLALIADKDLSYGGILKDRDATRKLALTLNGDSSAKQTLSNVNSSYSGGTTISSGTLIVGDDVSSTGNSPVGAGSVTLAGGKLAIGDGHTFSRPVSYTGGQLAGTGTFALGAAAFAIAPGNSVGTLHYTGDLTLTGVNDFELDGVGVNDLLEVTGTLTYGGTLSVSKLGGGAFAAADAGVYDLFNFTGYAGSFSEITLLNNPDNLLASFNAGTGELTLAVPEPATMAFLALGGMALAGGAIRRRRSV